MIRLYVMLVFLKTFHVALLVLMAVLQTVQGAFSGTTLCREESGKVALEWSEGGQCKTTGNEGILCINKSVDVAADHCQACWDVPVPSEKSVKSLTLASESAWIPVSALLEFVIPQPAGTFIALTAPPQYPASERLSSIRLLI